MVIYCCLLPVSLYFPLGSKINRINSSRICSIMKAMPVFITCLVNIGEQKRVGINRDTSAPSDRPSLLGAPRPFLGHLHVCTFPGLTHTRTCAHTLGMSKNGKKMHFFSKHYFHEYIFFLKYVCIFQF